MSDELIDELFVITFDGIRNIIIDVIIKIIDFMGKR